MFKDRFIVLRIRGRFEWGLDQSQGFICHIAVFVENRDHIFIPDDLNIFDIFSGRGVHIFEFRSVSRWPHYFGIQHSR